MSMELLKLRLQFFAEVEDEEEEIWDLTHS